MEGSLSIALIIAGFLVVFPLIWLGVTSLLGALSGWPSLQRAFADDPDAIVLAHFAGVSGSMGRFPPGGVQYGFSLLLEACESGLRIQTPKLLSPFAKPILVPWTKIIAEQTAFGFIRLMLGQPEVGVLRIRRGLAVRIASASAGKFSVPN